jgi:hypothetical protein
MFLCCLLCLHTLMRQADMLESSKYQGTEGEFWPMVHKELNSVNNHVNEVDMASSPVKSSDEIIASADTLTATLQTSLA